MWIHNMNTNSDTECASYKLDHLGGHQTIEHGIPKDKK